MGIEATLRTKWIDGSAHYVFRVKPLPSTQGRLNDVLKTVPRDEIRFTIRLLDKDGFEVCKSTPPLSYIVGPDGKYIGLGADQVFSDCNSNHFTSASEWRLSHRFPLLASELRSKTSVESVDTKKNPATTAQTGTGKPTTSFDGKLTGTDPYTGQVETLDQGSFQITRKAEYITVASWRAADSVRLSCEESLCVMTDLRYGESVHVKRSK